jgi:hypothetical protein
MKTDYALPTGNAGPLKGDSNAEIELFYIIATRNNC